MPSVSIIIPVYNAEKYLIKCIDSVVNQTFKDIEIIVIDDGSTDASLTIINQFAKEDSRIKVLREENKGAGAARNFGMSQARGKFLYFLDSDDFIEKNFINEMWQISERDALDFLVCRSNQFNCETKKTYDCLGSIREDLLPSQKIFSSYDVKKDAFNLFIWWPWDKFIRKSYIDKLQIKFQELKTTNDLFFICAAFLKAKRVSYTNEILVHHRIGNKKSLSNSREKSWNNFLIALSALEEFLKEQCIYSHFKKDFINYVLDFSLWQLETLHGRSFCLLYNDLKNKWFSKFELIDKKEDYFYEKGNYKKLCIITKVDVDEYLLNKNNAYIEKIESLQKCIYVSNVEKIDLKNENIKIKGENLKLYCEINDLNKKINKLIIYNNKLRANVKRLNEINKKILNSKSYLICRKIKHFQNSIYKKLRRIRLSKKFH